MIKLRDKQKQTEGQEILLWKLHRDYPSKLPYFLSDVDVSTTTLPETTEQEGIEQPLETIEAIELPLEITENIIKAILEKTGIEELFKLYVELIQNIPQVKKVLLFQSDDSNCILTIIEAPVFDFLIRKRIYETEQILIKRISVPSVEFRLLNSLELQEDLSKIITDDATILYKR